MYRDIDEVKKSLEELRKEVGLLDHAVALGEIDDVKENICDVVLSLENLEIDITNLFDKLEEK
jgi:hypothetical protein